MCTSCSIFESYLTSTQHSLKLQDDPLGMLLSPCTPATGSRAAVSLWHCPSNASQPVQQAHQSL
jgi:hypothetical protein